MARWLVWTFASLTLAKTPAPLPDLGANLPTGLCEQGPGQVGADSYHTGDITITGDTFTGTETWHLFANDKWLQANGRSCVVRYSLVGAVVPPVGCKTCDLALRGTGDVDIQSTTCETGLWSQGDRRRWTLDYAIDKSDDGSATVHFNASGNLLATGQHADDRVVYRSGHRCKWF